jgi:siroheme synthase-like protein
VLYPIFLKLDGREVLVVGAGAVAAFKTALLLRAGARVRVVAPEACDRVRQMAERGEIAWLRRAFRPEDAAGAALAIAATGDAAANDRVMNACRDARVLVNVVDDPDRCDFFVPATLERGSVQVAVSTHGESPAFAKRLRAQLEAALHPSLGEYVELLGRARRRIRERFPASASTRRAANEALLASAARERLEAGDRKGAERAIDEALAAFCEREAKG